MIDFTTKQLSYLFITCVTVGFGGYLSLSSRVDSIDKQLAVAIASADYTAKSMEKIEKQLQRIEEKIDTVKRTK